MRKAVRAVGRPSRVYTMPAPVGGWNASQPLVGMPETDALVMDNFYPKVGSVELRGGEFSYADGMTSWIKSFLEYHSVSDNKLFACEDAGIWDITTGGTKSVTATSCTDGDWIGVNMTTSGGSFLIAVNGVDAAKLFDGSSWSGTTISGVSDASLNNVVLHKNRLWFVEEATLDAWYLGSQSIGGTATKFPFGPVFPRGGHLVAQFVWTIDGGTGLDDYLVSVTSEGEIAVYQGTDPASADTWSLVGVYFVGKPLGKRCFCKYGGDVLYLSTRGIFLLSKLLLSVFPNRSSALSGKIDYAFSQAATYYQNNFGWQALLYSPKDAVIVNVPVTHQAVYYQFVMNDISKAWGRFKNWNFMSLIVFNEALYAGGDGEVHQLWVSNSDNGNPITGNCVQAYSRLGSWAQKTVSLIKPVIQIIGSPTINLRIDGDFRELDTNSTFGYITSSGLPLWDVAKWDEGVWDGVTLNTESNWASIPCEPAYLHSLWMQVSSDGGIADWRATYFNCLQAGVL